MKVEFSLSYNAKFNCVNVFGALSNQCVLSTVHMLCTLPTDKQNVHNTSAYAANKNIHQFAKVLCYVYAENKNIRQLALCVNAY